MKKVNFYKGTYLYLNIQNILFAAWIQVIFWLITHLFKKMVDLLFQLYHFEFPVNHELAEIIKLHGFSFQDFFSSPLFGNIKNNSEDCILFPDLDIIRTYHGVEFPSFLTLHKKLEGFKLRS